MKTTRTAPATFTIEFETEDELREEHCTNLSMQGLRVPTQEAIALYTPVVVTLRGVGGGEVMVKGVVVAALPGGVALSIEGNADEILETLLTEEKPQSAWDRIRGLTQVEKILLAVKADRSERALLMQDSDPRVLLSLLRNPRLTVDEVARIAKSAQLTLQIADVIVKTGQWMASMDVRLALIHNARTPAPIAMRILPTLPDAEVRNVARAGTSMALKTAALKQLQRSK